ncbi:MAG: YARHG domain-containing protein [Pseudomonadota bacterium]
MILQIKKIQRPAFVFTIALVVLLINLHIQSALGSDTVIHPTNQQKSKITSMPANFQFKDGIQQGLIVQEISNAGNWKCSLKAEAFLKRGEEFERLWTIQTTACKGEIDGEYYKTVAIGPTGVKEATTLYSLTTGTMVSLAKHETQKPFIKTREADVDVDVKVKEPNVKKKKTNKAASTQKHKSSATDTAYLMDERFQNLEKMQKKQLDLLRNEIYARHGYTFKNRDTQKYFAGQPWYQELQAKGIAKTELNPKEFEIVVKIKQLERSR